MRSNTIRKFLKENKVVSLVIETFFFLVAKTLICFFAYPMVYSTKFIFENWYRLFPRRFNPRKNIFEGVDFRAAVCSEPGYEFTGKPLIDFAGTQLNFANFSGMDLKGKVFSNAYADSANFCGADLTRAKFLNVDLGFADFRGANLTGCTFVSCSKIGTAKFPDPKEKGLISGALCEIVCLGNLAAHLLEDLVPGSNRSFDIDNGMMVMLFDVDNDKQTFSFTCPATSEIFRDLPLWLIHGTFVAVTKTPDDN